MKKLCMQAQHPLSGRSRWTRQVHENSSKNINCIQTQIYESKALVIETVAPDAAWRHCATHGLNLTLEKSVCFEHVGASVRSISSFCRGGNKHSTLVLHMMRIQKPSLASDDASCDKRLSDM